MNASKGLKRYFTAFAATATLGLSPSPDTKRRKMEDTVPSSDTLQTFGYQSYIENLSKSAATLISGGAEGADTAWAVAAAASGHNVIHMSFDAHRVKSVPGNVLRLSDHELQLADTTLMATARRLGRRFTTSNQYVANLLRRNFHQVSLASRVYAVGMFESSDIESPSPSLCISGGTAWACQIFADRMAATATGVLPLYFYDQATSQWYQPEVLDSASPLYRWQPIFITPAPQGTYAAIGSRELQENGRQAIQALYNTSI